MGRLEVGAVSGHVKELTLVLRYSVHSDNAAERAERKSSSERGLRSRIAWNVPLRQRPLSYDMQPTFWRFRSGTRASLVNPVLGPIRDLIGTSS